MAIDVTDNEDLRKITKNKIHFKINDNYGLCDRGGKKVLLSNNIKHVTCNKCKSRFYSEGQMKCENCKKSIQQCQCSENQEFNPISINKKMVRK